MPTVRRSVRVAQQTKPSRSSNAANNRVFNSTQRINKLPLEILSRVFILGEGMLRGPRASGHSYIGFQDLVTQVCTHWRDVAVSTPMLWTYIYVSRPPPHPSAQLYISRSGACSLDIDIDMTTPYIEPIRRSNFRLQKDRMLETMRLIIEYGGTVARWRSLVAVAKSAEMIFELIGLINVAPRATPSLQFVSLKWKTHFFGRMEDELEAIEAAQREGRLGDSHSLAHCPTRPQLRHVELQGLPNVFMFDRVSPIVSNLTTLTLVGGKLPLPVHGVRSVLSLNPQLESLCLSTGQAYEFEVPLISTGPLQVQLPFLRSLTLHALVAHGWALQLLQIIDAPGVEHFELEFGVLGSFVPQSPLPFCQYLRVGRSNGSLRCSTLLSVKSPNCGSIFPVLRHLDIPRVEIPREGYSLIFKAFHTATHITLNLFCLQALAEKPELLPNLSHITYRGSISSGFLYAITTVAARRNNTVTRISTLEIAECKKHVDWDLERSDREEDPEETTGRAAAVLRHWVDKLDMYRVEDEYPNGDHWVSPSESDGEDVLLNPMI